MGTGCTIAVLIALTYVIVVLCRMTFGRRDDPTDPPDGDDDFWHGRH